MRVRILCNANRAHGVIVIYATAKEIGLIRPVRDRQWVFGVVNRPLPIVPHDTIEFWQLRELPVYQLGTMIDSLYQHDLPTRAAIIGRIVRYFDPSEVAPPSTSCWAGFGTATVVNCTLKVPTATNPVALLAARAGFHRVNYIHWIVPDVSRKD